MILSFFLYSLFILVGFFRLGVIIGEYLFEEEVRINIKRVSNLDGVDRKVIRKRPSFNPMDFNPRVNPHINANPCYFNPLVGPDIRRTPKSEHDE